MSKVEQVKNLRGIRLLLDFNFPCLLSHWLLCLLRFDDLSSRLYLLFIKLALLLLDLLYSSLFQFQISLLIGLQLVIYVVNDIEQLSDSFHVHVQEGLCLYYAGHAPTHHQTSLVDISCYL